MSTLIVALNVEASGSNISDEIVAIGYVLRDENQVICKRTIALRPRNGTKFEFHPRSHREFWSTRQELLDQFRALQVPIAEGLQAFVDDLEKTAEKYQNYVVVSDNPSFDLGILEAYLTKYLKWGSLHFHPVKRNQYVPVVDVDSLQLGFQGKKLEDDMWANNLETYQLLGIPPDTLAMSHEPSDDALVISNLFMALTGASAGKVRLPRRL